MNRFWEYIIFSLLVFMVFSFLEIDFPSTKATENRKINPYEDMVNASVLIYDDSGRGSGVFIDDNVILTAAHVLEHPSLEVKLTNGTVLKADDFYIDDKEDVGFIFVDANEISIAKISLLPMQLGDTVFLVGTPFYETFMFSLTKGIISHLDRDIPRWNWEDLLQVDANGGPGSSGGPLYNSDGNLVGMYVGHAGDGGVGISLCEDAKSILEAYERAKECRLLPKEQKSLPK